MSPEPRGPGTLRGATRVAGLCYIVIIMLGVAQAALLSSRLPSLEDPAAVVEALRTHDAAFHVGVFSDVALYALVLILAVALYLVVRDVHPPLALGGLVLRSAEAVLGLSATVVGGAAPLLLLSDPASTDPASVVALLAVRESALDVILILVGLGGAVFCHLFFVSRRVPGALALWGVLTYASMVILGAFGILWPEVRSGVQGALFAQGALFEVVFGLWLFFKADHVSARAPVFR